MLYPVQIADITSRSTVRAINGTGYASTQSHFGEVLQGSFIDQQGRSVRGLTTLRCPAFTASARFELTDADELSVSPAHCTKAKRAAERTLVQIGHRGGGKLTLFSNIPCGIGAGSSTANVVTAIKAVAQATRFQLPRMEIARLAVETEGAVDPIMLRAAPEILFAHRAGTVIERFRKRLPKLLAIGFTDGEPVDTLSHPPARYTRGQVEEFEHLRLRLGAAIAGDDPNGIGEVATRSAVINQPYLPKPSFSVLLDIVREAGAIGLSVSHSGSAVALLFDPKRTDPTRQWKTESVLDAAGFRERWHFSTGGRS